MIEKLKLTDEEYYSQSYSDVPVLSYSIAKDLIQYSPKYAHYYHPKLGGNEKERTAAMELGDIVHKLMLGREDDLIIIQQNDYRKNATKQERDDILEIGKTPVLSKTFQKALTICDELRYQIEEDEEAKYFFDENAVTEFPILWEKDGVKLQSKLDKASFEIGVSYDLKTIEKLQPSKIKNHIKMLGYDIQAAMYLQAIGYIYPELIGRMRWIFIFIETKPPFQMMTVPASGELIELGSMKADIALSMWKGCLDNDKWPGPGSKTVYPDPWDYKEIYE